MRGLFWHFLLAPRKIAPCRNLARCQLKKGLYRIIQYRPRIDATPNVIPAKLVLSKVEEHSQRVEESYESEFAEYKIQ